MQKLRVSVTTSDGAANHYPITPAVMVDFERHFNTTFASAFADDPSMEQVFWLGWKAAQRSGAVVKPFDGWIETVDAVEPLMDEGSDIPFGEAAGQ